MRWINARYERSRWLICAAMVLLAVHYVLQMGHGLRASGDDVGAVINILFYTPCIMLISLGIINIECGRIFQKHYFSVGMCGLVVLGVTFLIGVYLSGSLHLGVILYVMFAQFIALLLYFIFISLHETHLRRKVIRFLSIQKLGIRSKDRIFAHRSGCPDGGIGRHEGLKIP